MSLPRELREMVYAAYFADLPSKIILQPGYFDENYHFPSIVPPLCYTDKQVLAESILVLLRKKEIIVEAELAGASLLVSFLDRVPDGNTCKAVTKVQLHKLNALYNWGMNSYIPPKLRLFHLCTGLQHLGITDYAVTLIKLQVYLSTNKMTRLSKAEVLGDFDLQQVYELPNLGPSCLSARGISTRTLDHMATRRVSEPLCEVRPPDQVWKWRPRIDRTSFHGLGIR
jgi:hypothetical protein